MTLYVGTSGWDYREWKPDFYPADLKHKDFLAHYATKLSACEINTTFYGLQEDETFRRWHDAVPDAFRFSIKAYRRLTHAKTIAPEGPQKEILDEFLRSLQPLEDKLGALLFQFPAYRKRDDAALEKLLDAVPVERCAFEFRDDSWANAEIKELIAGRGGTVCFVDTTGQRPETLPPGGIAYVRLRHERYDDDQRERWRDLLEREATVRDVYAFAKHEGVPAGDPHTGVGFAGWLAQVTSGSTLTG